MKPKEQILSLSKKPMQVQRKPKYPKIVQGQEQIFPKMKLSRNYSTA